MSDLSGTVAKYIDSGLGITAVKVGKDNNRKFKANEDIPVVFTFTRPFAKGETVKVKCHIYEEKFDLNFDRGIYTVSMEYKEPCPMVILCDPPTRESNPIKVKIPEVLAGATVNLIFSLQYGLKMSTDPSLLCKKVTVEVLSSERGPKIKEIYWSDTKEIRYGMFSAVREDALIKNETVYLHIHTRGLYGKQIMCRTIGTAIDIPRILTIKNNVHVEAYTFYEDKVTKIKMYCAPLVYEKALEKNVSKTTTIPYIKDEEVVLSTRTMQVYSYPNKIKDKDYASEAECRIDFRPTKSYDGSFGFSWYRVGDMKASTGYSESSKTYKRTNQTFKINIPCNDHPFSESDFPRKGILGKHYETKLINGIETNIPVEGINDSGTGSNSFTQQIDPSYFDPNKAYLPLAPIGPGANANPRDNFVPSAYVADAHKRDFVKISLFGYTEKKRQEYLTPVITLAAGKKATLQLFIHVKKSPKEILFVFDNPVVEGLAIISINLKKEIKKPPITNQIPNYLNYEITISCNLKFDKEVRLKVFAVPDNAADGTITKLLGRIVLHPKEGSQLVLPELCGILRILPNDDAHWRTIKVVFFNVVTNLDKNNLEKKGLTIPPLVSINRATDEENTLNKFLAQAYVKADVIMETINLSNNPVYENMCLDDDGDGTLDAFDDENHDYDLIDLLIADPMSVQYDKPDHYRLYFMPDIAVGSYGYSSGRPNDNCTICFSDALISTPAHELGHALKLPHTFTANESDNKAKYTYEDGKTDNIMDYSNQIGIETQSFYQWQWEAINTNLNK